MADIKQIKLPDGSVLNLKDSAARDQMEVKSNKVTALNSASTDSEYPSAKAVYDLVSSISVPVIDVRTPDTNSIVSNGIATLPDSFFIWDLGSVKAYGNQRIPLEQLTPITIDANKLNELIAASDKGQTCFAKALFYLNDPAIDDSLALVAWQAPVQTLGTNLIAFYSYGSQDMLDPIIYFVGLIVSFDPNEGLAGYVYAEKNVKPGEIPTNLSELTNDVGYITSYTETDPTVPSWAKASTKPTYTAAEVGALPSNTVYVSTVNGQSGAITIEEPLVIEGTLTFTLNSTSGSGTFTPTSGDVTKIPTANEVYIKADIHGFSMLSSDYVWLRKMRKASTGMGIVMFNGVFDTAGGTVYIEVEGEPDDEGDWHYAIWSVTYRILQQKLTSYVSSVNGNSGNVTITAESIGAVSAETSIVKDVRSGALPSPEWYSYVSSDGIAYIPPSTAVIGLSTIGTSSRRKPLDELFYGLNITAEWIAEMLGYHDAGQDISLVGQLYLNDPKTTSNKAIVYSLSYNGTMNGLYLFSGFGNNLNGPSPDTYGVSCLIGDVFGEGVYTANFYCQRLPKSTDIPSTYSDVGAASASHTHTAAQVGAVPTSRTINGKALTSNITLNAADVGALSTFTETDPTVPSWAKAASKPTYTYTEVGAASAGHTHTAQDVGAVPSDTRALQINIDGTWHPIADWHLNNISNYGNCVVLDYDIANDIWVPTLDVISSMASAVGQAIENVSAAIPTVVSDLDNDAGYITSAPTAVSQLTNDLNFATTSQVSTAITSAIGEINEFDVEVAAALPTQNIKDHTIYFVAKESSENDIYDEFMYINNAWEHIGSTEVDLSNYVTKTDNAYRAQSIFYGEVDSTSTSTNFTATISGLTELRDGVCILLKNGVVTSASGFTININGLGPKPSYSNMATGNDVTPTAPTRDTTIFNINYTMLFIYSADIVSGGGWIMYRGYDANSNTLGYQLRTNSSVRTATDSVGCYRLLFTSASGSQWVPTTNSTSTNSTAARTVNQRPIDPFGDIVYYGSTTILAPNDSVSATIQWQQYTLNIGYSFNRTGKAQVMTHPAPVYVKCAPQSDGSAIVDADTPYVQALPSSADGKIYIYLGDAYSATAVELRMNHPVYYYTDGGIRLWSGVNAASKSYVDAAVASISIPTEIFWVNVTAASPYTADQTYSAISDAIDNGQMVYVNQGGCIFALSDDDRTTGTGSISFEYIAYTESTGGIKWLSFRKLTIASDDTVSRISSMKNWVVNFPSALGTQGQIITANAAGNMQWSNMPAIPSTISQLTNDAGYLTLADLPIYDGSVS